MRAARDPLRSPPPSCSPSGMSPVTRAQRMPSGGWGGVGGDGVGVGGKGRRFGSEAVGGAAGAAP